MSASKEFLEEQADLLAANVAGWETKTIEYIGGRIKALGELTMADAQAINNIAEVKKDMDYIVRELARVTGFNISQIKRIYGAAIESEHNKNKTLYDYRNIPFKSFAEDKRMQAIVNAYSRVTARTMLNLSNTKALGFVNGTGGFANIEDTLYDVLGKAVAEIVSGGTTFDVSMRLAIEAMGGSGVRVDYGGGITRRLDTAVRQNLLWGAKQAYNEYHNMIGEELGCDGIEIDYHSFPRPSHEYMQGKQYIKGEARTIDGIFFESADRPQKSLEDYGCLHFATPIICGVSVPAYDEDELRRLKEKDKEPIEIDGIKKTGYEWKQTMRRLETEARKEKETISGLRASGDREGVRRHTETLRKIKEKHKQIADVTGIKNDEKRMRVYSGNGGLNGGKTLDNARESGIINAGGYSGAKKTSDWQERHGELMYEEIRKRTTDVKRISENTIFTENAVEEIKQHMFFKEHTFADGTIKRFESDFDQAQAWDRLFQGKGNAEDIELLKHEYVELTQMRIHGYDYETAHEIANKYHDWAKMLLNEGRKK